MNDPTTLLNKLKSYLITSVAPNAAAIDRDSHALQQALKRLAQLGVLGLRIPSEYGGLSANRETFDDYQELVARYSGALAFLQTQHQSAAAMISQSENAALKQQYLPLMSKGKLLLGIGFSHLRRRGEQLVKAFPVPGGFILEKKVPWVTGLGIFQEFIIAATLPNDEAVFGIVPLLKTSQEQGGKISFDAPMELAAMSSTNTVAATLHQWFLPQEKVVFIKPANWIHENDEKSILKQTTFLALGCAFAGIDILEAASKTKPLLFIDDTLNNLKSELISCKNIIRESQYNAELNLAEKQKLRAWAIELAVRCAHAAITVSSGAANQQFHPAQRVYREALVFTVSGQTHGIMEATLQRLCRSEKPQKTITYSRVIHLSHVIDTNIPIWPGDPPVELETVATIEKDGYYLRRFSMGEHSATHINAPISFHPSGIAIDRYPAESLVVPAVVIDISKSANANFDYCLTINDIWHWEQQNGKIPRGSVVLVYTGWQEKWLKSDENAFLNPDKAGNLHFPGIGSEATLFLIREREIAGLGIDTHGVDAAIENSFYTNNLMLEKPRIVLENLTNLDQLPARGTTLVIGILRLKNGSGSPVGVLAFLPN
ncbi:MAG TPA: cyclase family protein [Leptolyngbyaceae cyanobacterium]